MHLLSLLKTGLTRQLFCSVVSNYIHIGITIFRCRYVSSWVNVQLFDFYIPGQKCARAIQKVNSPTLSSWATIPLY